MDHEQKKQPKGKDHSAYLSDLSQLFTEQQENSLAYGQPEGHGLRLGSMDKS
jgi:hypothetical protein